jgi:hypothetical protein
MQNGLGNRILGIRQTLLPARSSRYSALEASWFGRQPHSRQGVRALQQFKLVDGGKSFPISALALAFRISGPPLLRCLQSPPQPHSIRYEAHL